MASAAAPSEPVPGNAQSAKSLYLLKRDYTASTRLNFQHYIWRQELGFNIHPSIQLPENAHIADVACGTAIWSLEVVQEHPKAQVSGLDISLRQCPAQAWLTSKNITLYEWDMNDPKGPPSGLEGKFDLVHIRLILLALDEDITPLLTNVLKLLKPGGYLQWDEADFTRTTVLHPDQMTATTTTKETATEAPYMTKLVASMAERSQKPWLKRLSEILPKDHDFETASTNEYAVNSALFKYSTDLILMVWDEIIEEIPDEAADRRAMLSQLVQGTKMDAAKGFVISVPKCVTVAVKRA